MKETSNKYLIVALLFGLTFHGSAIFFTLESTYDALIHMFFGNHYAHSWFEPWNCSWYTGFNVMSYPPLVHQAIGLLSLIGGLKFGMFTVAIIGIILFITGAFRFSLLITGNRTVAGYSAILAVVSSSFVETLHIFGQLPSIIGISVLTHSLTEVCLFIKAEKKEILLHIFVFNGRNCLFASCYTFIWDGIFCFAFNRNDHNGYRSRKCQFIQGNHIQNILQNIYIIIKTDYSFLW